MDALSDILKTIQLSANTFVLKGVGGPWGTQIRYRPQGVFHAVLDGQCYLREAGSSDLVLLKAGDVIAFPTGGDHWISDSPEGQKLTAENVVRVDDDDRFLLKTGNVSVFSANNGGQIPAADVSCENATTLLCGTLSYDTSVSHPFLRDLPCIVRINGSEDGDSDWLKSLVNTLQEEATGSSPGSSLMVDRLAEMLFVQLLRAHIKSIEHPEGYLAALSDPHIGLALNLIHTENEEKCTVESLCKAAAMSRTSFTEKFVTLIGSTPKAYLTTTRMLRAKGRLQHSNDSMSDIAEGAGYSSAAAFSKAMKKLFHQTPGEIRKASRETHR